MNTCRQRARGRLLIERERCFPVMLVDVTITHVEHGIWTCIMWIIRSHGICHNEYIEMMSNFIRIHRLCMEIMRRLEKTFRESLEITLWIHIEYMICTALKMHEELFTWNLFKLFHTRRSMVHYSVTRPQGPDGFPPAAATAFLCCLLIFELVEADWM